MSIMLMLVLLLALVFAYINGFHDAASSVAMLVSTRVLSPRMAVLWAAFFNFIAFLVFSTTLAGNMAQGVSGDALTLTVLASALLAAIFWGILTWWRGLPSSSSHALLGGLVGAVVAKTQSAAWLDVPMIRNTVIFVVLSPLIGFAFAFTFLRLAMMLFGHWQGRKVERFFRHAQLVSAALYAIGHGGNDAQKTSGVLVAAFISAKILAPSQSSAPFIPVWIVVLSHLAIAAGTLAGGWRIVRTLGMRVTKLSPAGGFSAESSGALALFLATSLGIPVSSTHTITGAIVGAGSVRKFTAVRWGLAGKIAWTWLGTVPVCALVSALTYWGLAAFGF